MKPKVLVVVPVYNEEGVLEASVEKVLGFTAGITDYGWRVLIADNASSDSTLGVAESLARKHPNVGVIHLDEKGRGRALKKAWSEGDADVSCYMDVDLSTGLNALPHLVRAVLEGSDAAIGNRYMKGSQTKRSLKRLVLSRGYNILLKVFLGVSFSDAQCGFKAVNRRVVSDILPDIKDNGWFFDTELLILSERAGLRITDVPVAWSENPDSKVKTVETIADYVGSILRLRRTL